MEDLSHNRARDATTARPDEAGPYPPSYMDRLMAAVERLPGPYLLFYLVLFLLLATVNHALAWVDGWLPVFGLDPILLLFPLWISLPPAIMTYLNSVAGNALAGFSSLLELEPEQLAELRYEFTTLPARGVILSSIAWFVIFLLPAGISSGPWARATGASLDFTLFMLVEGGIAFVTSGSTIYYHSLRQLGLVSRTVQLVKTFNLFRLDPVYAFSRLTSRTGAAWMLLLSLNLLTFPIEVTGPVTVSLYVLLAGLAVVAFVLPLQFVRRRLIAEKRRLLAELDRRLEATLARLHRALDAAEMAEMDPLDHALVALNAERDALNRIPTLPWRGGTLRAFLSAIALPLVLFILQTLIGVCLQR